MQASYEEIELKVRFTDGFQLAKWKSNILEAQGKIPPTVAASVISPARRGTGVIRSKSEVEESKGGSAYRKPMPSSSA